MVGVASGLCFVPPALLERHAKKCKRSKCIRCMWFHKGARRRRQCLLQDGKTTWLTAAFAGSGQTRQLRLGCVLCYNYLKSMTDGCTSDTKKPNLYHRKFGRFEVAVQPTLGKGTSNLERHSSSKIHREAVLHWEVAKQGSVPVMAPPQEEFQETLVKFRRGDSARSQGSGGASDKVVFMRWCLSEALLDRYRTALRNAWTIVLVRDERHGKLLIRFRATLKDMSVVCGVLGMVKLIDGSRAKDILNATTKILSIFATPRYEAPRMFRGGTRECDSHLKKHLQESVEMIVSDSAASEILAQQLGMGLRGSHETVFPNAKIIGRDRAHACQRLVKHPWKAESSVNSWMEDCLVFLFQLAKR